MTTSHAEEEKAELEVVAFCVAGQDFCFDIMSVREIRGWTETTVLPHSQAFVTGVINLRGSVVPVVDLAERLGFGATNPDPRNVIIIAVVGGRTVGLLADLVSDIIVVDHDQVHPVSDIVADKARDFISEIITVDDRVLRRLDLERLVSTSPERDVA